MANGLELSDLEREPRIEVTIDGCDEADTQLSLIKGGGGCQTQEKIVAEYSDKFVVIADYRKQSERLGEAWDYVPIEVVPMAYKPVMNKIETQMGGSVKLRMAKTKVCPLLLNIVKVILSRLVLLSLITEGWCWIGSGTRRGPWTGRRPTPGWPPWPGWWRLGCLSTWPVWPTSGWRMAQCKQEMLNNK